MSRAAPGVGILGGTFNPVHVGHLRAAEEVAEALELERVLFVPCAEPPHKEASSDLAPAALRLAWLRAALADNPRFAVEPLELERGGPSYSVDTLRALGARLPERPVFVLGQDAFELLGTWREPEAIPTLAHIAVVTRPPQPAATLGELLPECLKGDVLLAADGLSGRHREAGTWIRLLAISALEVSASDIRRRLRWGHSVRYLLPEPVRSDVERSGVYGAG